MKVNYNHVLFRDYGCSLRAAGEDHVLVLPHAHEPHGLKGRGNSIPGSQARFFAHGKLQGEAVVGVLTNDQRKTKPKFKIEIYNLVL